MKKIIVFINDVCGSCQKTIDYVSKIQDLKGFDLEIINISDKKNEHYITGIPISGYPYVVVTDIIYKNHASPNEIDNILNNKVKKQKFNSELTPVLGKITLDCLNIKTFELRNQTIYHFQTGLSYVFIDSLRNNNGTYSIVCKSHEGNHCIYKAKELYIIESVILQKEIIHLKQGELFNGNN